MAEPRAEPAVGLPQHAGAQGVELVGADRHHGFGTQARGVRLEQPRPADQLAAPESLDDGGVSPGHVLQSGPAAMPLVWVLSAPGGDRTAHVRIGGTVEPGGGDGLFLTC
ncbi:hypothetical protein GCM10010425_41480 [Streptomyces spororaveus]